MLFAYEVLSLHNVINDHPKLGIVRLSKTYSSFETHLFFRNIRQHLD